MPKRRKWGLRGVEVEFNAIVAKVRVVFGKKENIPKHPDPEQRARVRRIVRQELGQIATKTPQSSNVIVDTIAEIASKERKKAIRRGYYDDAIYASIVEYAANEFGKSNTAGAMQETRNRNL